jgi:hypothetical protein
LPVFSYFTFAGSRFIDILYNDIFTTAISEASFTITIIYGNYLLFKKIFKWNINFTSSFIVLLFFAIFKYVSTFNESYLKYTSLFGGLLNEIAFYIIFLFSVIGTVLPIYLSFKFFDKNGNFSTKDIE